MFFVACSSTRMSVAPIVDIPFPIFIKLFFSCNPWSTASAFEDFAEIKILASPNSFCGDFEFLAYLFKHFFGYERLVVPCIPIATSFWIFKLSIVERTIKDAKHSTERQFFTTLRSESFFMNIIPNSTTTKTIIGHPFKHLFDKRGFCLINFYMTFFMDCSTSDEFIPQRYASWSHTEFAFSSETSRYILGSIIILEFCLATEDHEEKFLIWIIGKCRSMSTNLH